jgi:uncharacterized protein (DUF58 family)
MPNLVSFLLLLFVIAALLRVDFFFTIGYLFLAIVVLSRVWVDRTMKHLSAHRTFTPRAFPGEETTVRLTLRNAGWLPAPWLEIHESLPVQLATPPIRQQVVSLGGRAERTLTYSLLCRRRGYYAVGPLTLQTGDLLGLVRRRFIQIEADDIIVYPRVVGMQELGLPTRSPHVVLPATSHLFEDPARLMGVRDYQRGDSQRRIHWPATASTGRLVVKQYQLAIARETLVCLSLGREDYPQRHQRVATELAIVVAASVASHIILREGLPAGLLTRAWDPLAEKTLTFSLPMRSERAHLMSILEVLARAEDTPDSSFVDLLRRQSVRLPWGTTLMVVTGRESDTLFDSLVTLRRAGFAVSLTLVQPGQPSDVLQGRADLLGIPVYRVWNEADLEAWG